MEILITGGNGFLGRHLIPVLQERGDNVRVLASPTGNTAWLEERGVSIFRGDLRTSTVLTEPMRGVDAVFHFAANTRKWGPMQDFYAVNVTGTENVCRAALAAGVRRLVHISTFTVYDMAKGRAVSEDDALEPLDEPVGKSGVQQRRAERMGCGAFEVRLYVEVRKLKEGS